MALGAIRELGKKDYKITAVDFESVPKNERLGFFSKYTHQTAQVREDEKLFVKDISLICQNERPVLIPTNRKSLNIVIDNSDELLNFCDFIVPDKETLLIADDKKKIAKVAKESLIPIPKTTSLEEHESVEEMSKAVHYPCIIKFRNGEAMGKKPFDRYKIVNNEDEFIKAYKKMHSEDEFPIASDYIGGNDIGVAVVMDKNSQPVDFICYESLREYPIEGGPSCYLKTVFDRNLLKYAVTLLQKINFKGIAMLDFKGTLESPFFLEINPRIWGSAPICDVSNSCFFESYVKAASGNSKPIDVDNCKPRYTLNKKMRFTPQSFACFLSLMKKSDNKSKVFKEYLLSFFDLQVSDGLFSFDDMLPYFKYLINFTKR